MNVAAEANRIGEMVGGKYRVTRLLAKGGMGVVYEAQHAVVRRRFAIKFLRRDLADRRDILTRFQHEAESAGALENENVAAAVDFGIADDGTPYIVMEYLVGEDLASLLERQGRVPIARAADLIVQACRGVAAAHAADIVHRDLKPSNLFVSRRDDGTDLVKVLDFGVAKLQALEDQSAVTRTGAMLGTAAYMAPEQARGDRTVDARADVYALGAILYELLSLKRPHPGDSQNAILHHIASQAAVPIASVQPDVPPEMTQLLERALASDPGVRPLSVEALGRTLTPFARREVWPAPPQDSGPRRLELTSTLRAVSGNVGTELAPPAPSGRREPTLDDHRPAPRPNSAPPRRWRAVLAGAVAIATVGAVVAVIAPTPGRPPRNGRASKAPHRVHRLDARTRFLGSEPPPGAAPHIDALLKADRAREAALVSAMIATPSAIWILGGTPEQARAQVADAAARAARQGSVAVLVAYNHPFRDCTGYGLLGAKDTAAYQTWIDGFAAGIGNEEVIVILEPNGLGMVPYGVHLDGKRDECQPTRAGADGRRTAPPGATADERYAQLAQAVDTLVAKAPNAAVYLDGTHSAWLPVADAAYRLARAGVDRTAGFFLNAGNYQPTRRLIQYGTWIAKCAYLVDRSGADRSSPGPYRQCASQSEWMDPSDDAAWTKVESWYVEHVDHGPHPPSGPDALAHFVINTNRNGRGPLDVSVYGRPPYNQPAKVVQALRAGAWCMPPGRGLGFRPTADTRIPLVDAYLWTDTPGSSVATCDIAEGARAWEYGRYNPWHLGGEAQAHFDPLWGRVLPPAGDWFPDEALTLARNADPPLGEDGRPRAGDASLAQALDPGPTATFGRSRGQAPVSGGHSGGRRSKQADAGQPPASGPRPTSPPLPGPTQPLFDRANPYR